MYKVDRNGKQFQVGDRVAFCPEMAPWRSDIGVVIDISYDVVGVLWDSDGERNTIGNPKYFEIVDSNADMKESTERTLDAFLEKIKGAFDMSTTIKKNSKELESLLSEYNKYH